MAFTSRASMVLVAVAVWGVGTPVAQAQPSANCRFGAGLGANTACASEPQDDYSDFIFYPPTRGGFGGWGGGMMGGLYADDSGPGISAGPGR